MHHGALAQHGSNEWLASSGGATGCTPAFSVSWGAWEGWGPKSARADTNVSLTLSRRGAVPENSGMAGRGSAFAAGGSREPPTTSQGSPAGVEEVATGALRGSIVSKGVSGPVSSSSETRPKCFERRSITSG